MRNVFIWPLPILAHRRKLPNRYDFAIVRGRGINIFNFRMSYIFEVNEVSEVNASLEVNDNRYDRWRIGENSQNNRKNYRR